MTCYLLINNAVTILVSLKAEKYICLLSLNNKKSSFQWRCFVLCTFLSKCLARRAFQVCSPYQKYWLPVLFDVVYIS